MQLLCCGPSLIFWAYNICTTILHLGAYTPWFTLVTGFMPPLTTDYVNYFYHLATSLHKLINTTQERASPEWKMVVTRLDLRHMLLFFKKPTSEMGVGVHGCNSHSGGGGTDIKSLQPPLHIKFQPYPGYMRPCHWGRRGREADLYII